MADNIETLVERLNRGESINEVLRSLVSPAEREFLKHCAVVRAFDREVVEEVFRPLLTGDLRDALSFERLVRRAEVKQVAEGVYRLRESARSEYFDSWWDAVPREFGSLDMPPQLRELSSRLAGYYAGRGPEWGLEVLYHNVAARPAEALARFEELYASADAAFDLAQCQDLIGVFEDRPRLMNDDMRAAVDRSRAHLRARTLWAREFYQTANYYELPEMRGLWEEVLGDASRWILQLYAPGGMGKTMFIRWLVARRCVPAGVPCALLDFDRTDVMAVVRDPLRMLLQVAAMLNEQTVGLVFSYLINELKSLLSGAAEGSDEAARHRESFASQSLSWARRFASALAESPGRSPLVLVFDTLEEVILYQQGNLLRLIEFVSLLHGQSPNVRLVLAGRYNLADEGRLPGFARKFGGQTRTLTLRPFTEAEALGYLREKRGLAPSPAHDAAVQRSGGSPFKLAVFADLLRADPSITAEQIRAYPTADLLYLIRRVVSRIKNPNVRWLLRYGVVPRRLTRSFVSAVMRDFLPQAISGAFDLDDPRTDLPSELSGENPFEHSAVNDETIDLNGLWRTLISYAADYSWVSATNEGGEDALSFHQDVLNPMRDLLRRQPVYGALHRAAADYFARRADEDPARWIDFTREVVYHRFQLEGEGAGGWWLGLLEGPRVADDPKARRAFAEEIRGPEYIDDEHRPLPHGGGRIVSAETLARAFFELARANAELARKLPPSHQAGLWQEAQSAFRAFEEMRKGLTAQAAPRWRVLVVRSLVQANRGEFTRALETLSRALKDKLLPAERAEVETELARLSEHLGQHGEAAAHYRAALAVHEKFSGDTPNFLALSLALAHNQRLNRNFDEAVRVYLSVLEGARRLDDRLLEVETRLALGETFLEMNLPAAADKCLTAASFTEAVATSPRDELSLSHRLILLGRVRLAERDVPGAVVVFEDALKRLEELPQGESEEWRDHWYRLLGETSASYGEALAEMLKHEAALNTFERARSIYGRLNDEGGANRCLLLTAEAQLRGVGNVKEAEQTLEQAGRFGVQTSPPRWLEQQLLLAEIYWLAAAPAEAAATIWRLSALARGEDWGPALLFRIDAARLSTDKHLNTPEVLGELLRSLRAVSPPTVRFGLLRLPVWGGSWGKVPPQFVKEFEELFPLPPASDDDFPARAGALADALRVLGQRKRPAQLLRQAFEGFQARRNLFGAFEILSAYNRVEGRTQALTAPEVLDDFVGEFQRWFGDHRMLCATLLLEHGQYLLKRRELERADDALLGAEKLMETEGDASHRRARVFELRARVAAARIDAALKEWEPARSHLVKISAEASEFFERAADMQEFLGNAHAYRRLRRQVNAERRRLYDLETLEFPGPGAGAKFESPAEAEFRRAYDPRRRGYVVRFRRPKKNELQIEVRVEHQGLPRDLRADSRQTDSSVIDELPWTIGDLYYGKLSELLASDFRSVSRGFRNLFSPLLWALKELPGRVNNSPQDIRLEIQDPNLAALPWELFIRTDLQMSGFDFVGCLYRSSTDRALFNRQVTWLQRSLKALFASDINVSGRYDWRTERAVMDAQAQYDLPTTGVADYEIRSHIKSALREMLGGPSALVIDTGGAGQKYSRWSHDFYGAELAGLYRSEDFKLVDFYEEDLSNLPRVLSEYSFEVIHLCPMMRFSAQLGIYLDFTGGRDEYYDENDLSAAGKLTLNGLNQALKAQRQRRPGTTLVVLDVLRAPGAVATFSQLLLRNAFASELFRMGGADAVIAAGLGERPERERFSRRLIKSVYGGEPLGKVVGALADMPRHNLRDPLVGVASGGAVLFAHDPWD